MQNNKRSNWACWLLATSLTACTPQSPHNPVQPIHPGAANGGHAPGHAPLPIPAHMPGATPVPNVVFSNLSFYKLNPAAPNGANVILGIQLQIANHGPGAADVNGSCSWTCPPQIGPSGGTRQILKDQVYTDGQKITIGSDGGEVCTVTPVYLPLSCKFSVSALDSHYRPIGTPTQSSWQGQAPVQY